MSTLTEDQKLAIIDRYDRNPEQVLNILLDIQYASKDGYIDQQTAKMVAKAIGVTETRVYEQISFYALLKDKKQARYVFHVCDSSPCHFGKEAMVAQVLEKTLDIKENEITADGLFSYEKTPCVGLCDQVPFVKIKEKVFSHLTEEKIVALIAELRQGKYAEEL